MPSISIDQAKDAIRTELNILQNDKIPDRELTKLKNAVESSLTFSEVSALNKAISLAYFEVLGDANLINEEAKRYQEITADDLRDTAQNVFKPENCSEVIYLQQK